VLRHCAFTVNPHRPASPSAGPDLANNSLGGVECTAHYPGSRGVANIVSLTMSLLNIKDLAVAIFTRTGPAHDDPPLYINEGRNQSRLFVVKERVELLIELSGR